MTRAAKQSNGQQSGNPVQQHSKIQSFKNFNNT